MSKVLRASTLINCHWLAEKLGENASNFRLLDGSWHLPMFKRNARQEFYRNHIPGAQFFDIDECSDKTSELEHMLPPPQQFEEYVSKLGINNNTHVVVYDNQENFGLMSAQRVWWTFRVFGHDKISILDGGLPKWIKDDYSTTDEVEKVGMDTFKATFNPTMVRSFEDIKDNLHNKEFTLIDARPAGRFEGTAPEPRPEIKPGHIPDSVNIPFTTALDMNAKVMKSPEELKALFESKGLDVCSPLVACCGSGITATMLALAAYQCGNENVAIYDGAWTEWFKRAGPKVSYSQK